MYVNVQLYFLIINASLLKMCLMCKNSKVCIQLLWNSYIDNWHGNYKRMCFTRMFMMSLKSSHVTQVVNSVDNHSVNEIDK